MKENLRALFARKYFIKYQLSHSVTKHVITGWTLRHLWPWQNLVINIKELRVSKLHEFDTYVDTFDITSVDRV